MVRSTIQKLVEKWPEGGIALHGTTYGNVHSIKRFGIVKGAPYVCPFPMKLEFAAYSPGEILERSIGSALFANNYAMKKTSTSFGHGGSIPQVNERDLPAIVILKGNWSGEFTTGYDEDKEQTKSPLGRAYRSFGKEPGKIPANRVAGSVRITPTEYAELMKKANGRSLEAGKLIRSRLTIKTLAAIRKLIEHGEK